MAAILVASLLPPSAARAADTAPLVRLTVELNDGSRVVGTSVDKNLKFHSASLGDLKLAVKDIRSVERATSNTVTVATTAGDTLSLSLATSKIAVLTSFGKVELPADSIHGFRVAVINANAAQRTGLISLWPGEGNGMDVIGGNNGSLPSDVGYSPGVVNRAFDFPGHATINIPDRPSLNPVNGLTIEFWIYVRPKADYKWSQNVIGKDGDCNGQREYKLGVGDSPNQTGTGDFRAHIGVPGGFLALDSVTVVQSNTWYHVAETWDGATMKLYVNGKLDGELAAPGPLTVTAEPVRLGGGTTGCYSEYCFDGLLDEPALYDHALSAEEIQADYAAGNKN
ncbi:MAG TPA: LamG domain-containing protein [Verrucomicrobiae bacterium]|nr:LamG domain-containing protein [Verrucomicrobiae bacterium]